MSRRSIYPTPFKDFIPQLFHNDELTDKLAAKVDAYLENLEADIRQKETHNRPDEIDPSLINELGILLAANILNADSEATRRRKVATAIETQKNRSTFKGGTFGGVDYGGDVKNKIDAITGLSPGARIENAIGTDAWVFVGDADTNPSGFLWASMAGDGATGDLGLHLIGNGDELELKGVIFIDLHEGVTTAVLTAAQIEQIKLDLEDSAPAYFRIKLGYIDGSGVFTTYAGGIIG